MTRVSSIKQHFSCGLEGQELRTNLAGRFWLGMLEGAAVSSEGWTEAKGSLLRCVTHVAGGRVLPLDFLRQGSSPRPEQGIKREKLQWLL